ncbi:MAG: tRNA (adenosine(37)-N6)-threonylcarbamoyltransferase complex ATPase subunit type 1 TsaE [Candidatus Yonathbacteria bacterium RIFOXYC2_FULL_47_9]|nr:MAG: tRNA (adenosine(37)-N6)-threonylcarbamoyltransferase complex ATPase subunit type 1 TsaE [Candidatus Yonathbacteria bacterium RIFOXYC2_FULL_47_9]HAT68274.1 tRNA (adenosine(37)-N6)-threonylcarbamoyltransferase complex ATPase subunit type 1 TsaE [Candidatus Yonathbacteria bacterium]
MTKEVKNLIELRAVAEGFLRDIASRPPQESATTVGLSGDLGAGKTAFVKCIAAALGITEVVTSPTFILEKVYIIPRNGVVGDRFLKLIHIDAYRLHSGDEMRALDWEAILADKTNLIFLEWPEQVVDAMPKDMTKLSFNYVSEGVRSITIEGVA